MNRTIIFFGVAALLTAVSTTLAFANEPYFPRAARGFERLDINKDGKVDLSEFRPLAARRHASADANGDKIVTPLEIDRQMQARLAQRRDRMFQLLDGDRDGKITAAELDKVAEAMFNGADTDKDGSLTMAEMKSFKRGKWRKSFIDHMAPKPDAN